MIRTFFTFLLLALSFSIGPVVIGAPAACQEQADKQQLDLSTRTGRVPLDGLLQWFANGMDFTISADTKLLTQTSQSEIRFFGKNPIKFSERTAVPIVQSILRSNGLALVQSGVEDTYQIVQLADVRSVVPVTEDFGKTPGAYGTGVFSTEHITPAEAESYIKTFLYKPEDKAIANITLVPGQNLLVVTETNERLQRIKKLLDSIDVEKEAVFRTFYQLKKLQAAELKQQLDEVFGTTNETNTNSRGTDTNGLKIAAITSTNQLLISGSKSEVETVIEIAEKIDVEKNLVLRTHRFTNVSAKRIDELVRQAFRGMKESEIDRVYQANVNEQSNELVANTQPQVHARIDTLKRQLDVETSEADERSPMRFYTLKNVKAIDIVDTLQSIEQRVTSSRFDRQNRLSQQGNQSSRGIVTVGGFNDSLFRGPQNSSGLGGPQSGLNSGSNGFGVGGAGAGLNQFGGNQTSANPNVPGAGNPAGQAANANFGPTNVVPGDARITVDENTNTLIIVAEPATQKLYATLIERLDVRRPQVMIEVNIVSLSQQDDATLGVEFSGGDRDGTRQLFGVNLAAGEGGAGITDAGLLTVSPVSGFTGALLDPQTADVVLRALARHQKARVTATPRILVNDNAVGTLSSTEELPFQASSTNGNSTFTSVGGFLQAGTTINVTPQISEDDYLNLEFDILVNDFVGTSSAEGLPPGRSTNQVSSSVSIPDGHTIVVGGLSRKRIAEDLIGLPLIERIPILNRLTSTEVDSEDESKLFVFIKPIILRDDKFQDLRFLSEEERREASMPDDLPYSSPILVR